MTLANNDALREAIKFAQHGFPVFPGTPGHGLAGPTADFASILDFAVKEPDAPWAVRGRVEHGLIIVKFGRERCRLHLERDWNESFPATLTIERGNQGTEYRVYLATFATGELSNRHISATRAFVSACAPLPGSVEPKSGELWTYREGDGPGDIVPLPRNLVDRLPLFVAFDPRGITRNVVERAEWTPGPYRSEWNDDRDW